MKWQPIETAPRNGTWVLLWRGPSRFGTRDPMVIGCYCPDDDGKPAWVWPKGPFDPFTEDGQEEARLNIELNDIYEEGECADGFTHWMPLPEPPPTND